jgi:glycine hydroxymethyltransferase
MQEKSGPKLKDFLVLLEDNDKIKELAARVHAFASKFPMPGFDPKTMKYTDPNGPPKSA